MFYLYFGYVIAQSISVIEKFSVSNISASAAFFSIIVFLIWSFFPITGYLVAKLFKAQGQLSSMMLFIFGIGLGVVERSLYYLEVLAYGEENTSLAIAFALSVVIGFISINAKKQHKAQC